MAYAKQTIKKKKITFNKNKSKLASGNYKKCSNCRWRWHSKKKKKVIV